MTPSDPKDDPTAGPSGCVRSSSSDRPCNVSEICSGTVTETGIVDASWRDLDDESSSETTRVTAAMERLDYLNLPLIHRRE